MACIKTGADVYFSNYDCLLHGDLHQVGEAVVLYATTQRIYGANVLDTRISHEIELGIMDQVFDRLEALNILVVPMHCLTKRLRHGG